MIYINANLDLKSVLNLDVLPVEELIKDFVAEPLYVTFFAREEEFEPKVYRRKGKTYLRIILPYEEVLQNEDNFPLMLTYLAKSVDQLKWLDYNCLKERITELLHKESVKSSWPQRKEEALHWKKVQLEQIKFMERVRKSGPDSPIRVRIDDNQIKYLDQEEE